MNKLRTALRLLVSDDYFVIVTRGDTIHTDISIDSYGEDFIRVIRKELHKMLKSRSLFPPLKPRTHKESK